MRYVAFRLFVLVFTCTVILCLPFIEVTKHYHTAESGVFLPVAGETYPVYGQDDEATDEANLVLRAQASCVVGELVRFDASESTVDGIIWQIKPHSNDFEVIENGRRAFFSSRTPGEYLIIVAAAAAGKPFLVHHTIVVEGEVGPPKPENLGHKIGRWFADVKTPNKIEEARRVAGVFRTLATTEIETAKILEATAIANREALGESLNEWIPFLENLGKELDLYVEQGLLSSREQYTEVWAAIANGLEQATKQE